MTALMSTLREIVGDAAVLTGADAAAYTQGARYGAGRALCVVRPKSAEQVSRIVTCCAAEGVQVVPQGANTGLVGASTPDESGNQVVLSLNRVSSRCVVDAQNRTVDVDAGVLLHELNEKLAQHGLWFPVDLAADPSVGGMISCNTGGTRLIRYGDVRRNLLAVEAVLFDPPGEIVRFGKSLRKNNTGFDLSQLFVGTSGAAGIVTGATLEASPLPKQRATALIVPERADAVAPLVVRAEAELGDFLCAVEGLSRNGIRAATKHNSALRPPFADSEIPEFTLLIELASCASPDVLDLDAVLMRFLEECLETGDVTNAVFGRGDELWKLRHTMSDGARALGRVIAFDISVRRGEVMRFRRDAMELIEARYSHLEVVDFGHVGDGGLHFNLVWPTTCEKEWSSDAVAQVRDEIYAIVVERFGGSYSAEHGVGPHNIRYYQKYATQAELRLAGHIQEAVDPHRVGGTAHFGSPVLI